MGFTEAQDGVKTTTRRATTESPEQGSKEVVKARPASPHGYWSIIPCGIF